MVKDDIFDQYIRKFNGNIRAVTRSMRELSECLNEALMKLRENPRSNDVLEGRLDEFLDKAETMI